MEIVSKIGANRRADACMTLLLLLVCVSCTVAAERELSFDHHRKPSRYSGHFRINVGNHEDMTLIAGHQKQRIQISTMRA